MSIFKACDIRGTYPDQINEELSRAIGNATAQVLAKERLVVGRDMRPEGEGVTAALIEGITDAGVDIGLCNTPADYFAIGYYDQPGGIMRDLQKRVLEEKAAFGACFDGDGDRCAFIKKTMRRHNAPFGGGNCRGSITSVTTTTPTAARSP